MHPHKISLYIPGELDAAATPKFSRIVRRDSKWAVSTFAWPASLFTRGSSLGDIRESSVSCDASPVTGNSPMIQGDAWD